ncbi:MAG: Dabb family protein [Opitutae bacterium]|nr:Dabb family protein [Opitutae bacterium]
MLVHNVFFWLKPELTAAQRAEFRRGVESLLTIKPHVAQGFVGTPAAVADRPVVDKTYSVALTIVCRDVAAHNAYQVDPVHLAFVEKFKSCWTRVQIYDAE